MGFQSKVSDEFKMFEQTSQTAFKEAAESEHGASSGCDLPLGTRGIVAFTGMNAGQTKGKVVNNVNQPGKPYVIMELQVVEPEAAKGRKYNKYFDLSDHPNYSKAQKICDMIDYMEDAGMPKEVRKAGTGSKGIEAWCAEATRTFKFEVVDGYGGRREIKPFIDIGGIPTGSATANALAAANTPAPTTFGVGEAVLYAGKAFLVESVNGDRVNLKSQQSGNILPEVSIAEIKPL